MMEELFAATYVLNSRHGPWAAWLFPCLFKTLELKICHQNSNQRESGGKLDEVKRAQDRQVLGNRAAACYVSSLRVESSLKLDY